MGLILILVAGAALGLLGAPAFIVGAVVCGKSPRGKPFWSACLAALLLSVVAQYAVALLPFAGAREYSWDMFLAPMFGWHLAAPIVLAASLWFAGGARGRPALSGIVAGLLFSIPSVIGLAIPLGFVAPSLLGLKFRP